MCVCDAVWQVSGLVCLCVCMGGGGGTGIRPDINEVLTFHHNWTPVTCNMYIREGYTVPGGFLPRLCQSYGVHNGPKMTFLNELRYNKHGLMSP